MSGYRVKLSGGTRDGETMTIPSLDEVIELSAAHQIVPGPTVVQWKPIIEQYERVLMASPLATVEAESRYPGWNVDQYNRGGKVWVHWVVYVHRPKRQRDSDIAAYITDLENALADARVPVFVNSELLETVHVWASQLCNAPNVENVPASTEKENDGTR